MKENNKRRGENVQKTSKILKKIMRWKYVKIAIELIIAKRQETARKFSIKNK